MQKSQLPSDITKFVDLNSPILKYLVEIEKKFWRSHTNASFKHFSQILSSRHLEDSEDSLESLKNVQTYALASQNDKRLRADNSFRAKMKLFQADERSRNEAPAFKSLPREGKIVSSKPLIDLKDFNQARALQKNRLVQAEVLVVPAALHLKNDSSYSKQASRNPATAKTFFNPSQKDRVAGDALQVNTNHRREASRELAPEYEINRLKLHRVVKDSAGDFLQQPRGLESRSKSPYELNSSASKPLVISKIQPNLQFSYSSLLNGSSVGQKSPQRTQSKQRTAIIKLKDPRDATVYGTTRPNFHLSNIQFNLKRNGPSGSFRTQFPGNTSNFSSSNYLLLHNHPNPSTKHAKQRANISDRRLVPSSSRAGFDSLHLSAVKDKSLLNIKKGSALKTGLRQSPRPEASAVPDVPRMANKLLYATIKDKLVNRNK